jgi:hypothetical protein
MNNRSVNEAKDLLVPSRHSRGLLAGIQPHGYPVIARAWIPAKSLRE